MGAAEGGVYERLLGVWELLSIRETLPDGSERDRPEFGRDPVGLLIYTPSGHVSVHFMRRDRTAWEDEESAGETERAAALAGYGGYAGRFTVGAEDGRPFVLHRVEVAVIPNRVGRNLKRFCSFEEDRLTLQPEPVERNGSVIRRSLTWRRVTGQVMPD
jgi:hypothetical protein